MARIAVPAQPLGSAACAAVSDGQLAFDPWNAVAAHRPLGASCARGGRLIRGCAGSRSRVDGLPLREPSEAVELPG